MADIEVPEGRMNVKEMCAKYSVNFGPRPHFVLKTVLGGFLLSCYTRLSSSMASKTCLELAKLYRQD